MNLLKLIKYISDQNSDELKQNYNTCLSTNIYIEKCIPLSLQNTKYWTCIEDDIYRHDFKINWGGGVGESIGCFCFLKYYFFFTIFC